MSWALADSRPLKHHDLTVVSVRLIRIEMCKGGTCRISVIRGWRSTFNNPIGRLVSWEIGGEDTTCVWVKGEWVWVEARMPK
jgi:hypothetical protein